jgi:hypothetical protein
MYKNIVLNVLAFVLGLGSGFLLAKKLLNENYALLAQEEIDSVREVYLKRQNEDEENKKEQEKIVEMKQYIFPEALNSISTRISAVSQAAKNMGAVLSRSSLDGTLTNKYDKEKRNYNIIRTVEEDQEKIIENEEADEDDGPVTDASGMTEQDHKDIDLIDEKKVEPYLITEEQYSEEFASHDKLSLYYYKTDSVLCDENQDVIDNVDEVVGTATLSVLNKRLQAWVRNERLGADYEIIGLKQSYSEAILGIIEKPTHEPVKRIRKRRDHNEE